MKEKVIYISYDGLTDPLGQSQIIPYLQPLSKAGFHFSIVSCEKEDRYERLGTSIRYLLEDARIDWHPVMYKKSPPGISTLINMRNLKKEVYKLFEKKEFSLVHCRSYLPSIIGLAIKKKYNIPFVFDMRGFWVDERVEGGLWNKQNPIYKFAYSYFKTLESELIQNADAIISLTNAGKEEIRSWKSYKESRAEITVIPCSCDFDFYKKASEEEINKTKSSLGINKEDLVISYVGSVGTWYMLDEMLEFFKILLNHRPDSYFLIFTPDPEADIINKCFEQGIPVNRIKIMFVAKKEFGKYIGMSDYGLFFIKPCYSKIASSPTKLGELLSMGIPVITNSGVGDVDEIVESCNGGIVIPQFNKHDYLAAVKSLLSGTFTPDVQKAAEIFDISVAINKYQRVYKSLLQK